MLPSMSWKGSERRVQVYKRRIRSKARLIICPWYEYRAFNALFGPVNSCIYVVLIQIFSIPDNDLSTNASIFLLGGDWIIERNLLFDDEANEAYCKLQCLLRKDCEYTTHMNVWYVSIEF